MRAVTIADGALHIAERPIPEPAAGQVRVRVQGAGINRADLIQRLGLYPAPPGSPPDIPGLEFAGVVDACGDGVTQFTAGDHVFGIAGGGAQAEYLVIPAAQCARVPDGLDLVAMGGVPEAFVTAHDALVTWAEIRAGEWMLVHAVGSGVGTAALQLARALGARVIGTARTPDKLERCRDLGLARGIVPPRTTDGALDVPTLAAQLQEETGGGVDVTLDLVGGDYVEADLHAAALKGRIVVIGTLAGGSARLPLLSLMSKRLSLFGTVLRARTDAEKGDAVAAFARDVVPFLASGTLDPVVDRVFPMAEAEAAYALVESDTTFGKVILDCS
ncbi:MAG TPA: NAD(P)H-quinone oxidoreductase [Acidimicrobiia bacterium]|nr:NAD(P)H-quinone oxidoreductase [Acidimicrobiia bacterium]